MLQKPKTLGTRTQNTCYQNPKRLLPEPKMLSTRPQNNGCLKLQAGTYFSQYVTFPLFCSNLTCIYHALNIWQ